MLAHRVYTRRTEARKIREEAAEVAYLRRHPDHHSNGEEEDYRRGSGRLSYIANFSKGLKHNYIGEVVPDAYRTLLRALHSGDPVLFERNRMMGMIEGVNMCNPQAGLAFDLEGADAQAVTVPPAPRIDEPENSSEMGELYWMAVCRDVPFRNYGASVRVGEAALSLSRPAAGGEFTAFRGPMQGDAVTRGTVFRGFTPGDLTGPYLSQFLLKPITYGALTIEQRIKKARARRNFLMRFPIWLKVQRGLDRRQRNLISPGQPGSLFQPAPGFICTLRDLATYVHFDALYEAYLNACLILLNMPARVDPGNPYIDMPSHRTQRTQDGFGTFGPPHVLTLVTEVATRALKAVWFQKWGVHRRLRPEEFGGRLHVNIDGLPAGGSNPAVPPGRYPMIDPEILRSLETGMLSAYFPRRGTYLLPQAFIEGSPIHPAYGAGHATVAGACVTILKAWFDESEVFDPGVVSLPPNTDPAIVALLEENRRPKVPNAACDALEDYNAPQGEPLLTVGGELNKLAANISLGRNAAGVHWRSDYTESVKLGERIAIRLLQEQKPTYNEDHHLSLTRFDGRTITI